MFLHAAGKRNKDLQPKIELSAEEKQLARQQFEKLTEAASSLMDSGELDIYSQKKVIALPYSKGPATAVKSTELLSRLHHSAKLLTSCLCTCAVLF